LVNRAITRELFGKVRLIMGIAGMVILIDRITKLLVQHKLQLAEEKEVVSGFFRIVHWGNTGAAWSLFKGYNDVLVVVGVLAIVLLLTLSHHFDFQNPRGRIALALMLGGIIGNLIDRISVGHVVDFLYFYITIAGGQEVGFPAFNIADASICVGVGLVFYNAWRKGGASHTQEEGEAQVGNRSEQKNTLK